jgi:hypothetical protein
MRLAEHAFRSSTLLFEILKRGVVGAGQFHDVPFGLQLKV